MTAALDFDRTRRACLAAVAACLAPVAPARAAEAVFVVQDEPHLAHARALVRAALDAAGMPARFADAPGGNETRNVHQISSGQTDIDMMPATPTRLRLVREGRLRMVPVPLDRGLLGWRVNLLLQSQRDKLAGVRTAAGLARFTMGQNVGWMDVEIYRAAGIPTKEIKHWSEGEFAEQMEAGFLDLFPLGLEETLNYFLPHFRKRYPQLTVDPHILVRYPWFRFVWVAPGPRTDALYAALHKGFGQIAADGTFLRVWSQHRQPPGTQAFARRTRIDIPNPFYDHTLVPPRFRHLLFEPGPATPP